jgi:glycosyltransferase involved in cell wall biosynthesis
MRIMMLTQSYPPITDGISHYVRSLGVELACAGHDICVVTLWNEGLPEFEIDDKVEVYRVKGSLHRARDLLYSRPGRLYAPPFPDPEFTFRLRSIAKKKRPQVVHAHDWLLHSFIPLKKRSGAKLVVTLHDYSLGCAKWSLIYNDKICDGPSVGKCIRCTAKHYGRLKGAATLMCSWAMGYFVRSAVDYFIPVTNAVARGNRLIERGLEFRTVPNCTREAVEEAAGANREYVSQLPGSGYILFVGAFAKNKGVGVLLTAYQGIRDAPPLVLVGYETDRDPSLPGEIPENVIVFRDWPHDAVMEAWRHCSMGLVPSVWLEPCPAVAFEAMMMGKPVIGSRIGGLVDIVDDGVDGYLVAPGDPIALRQSMEKLLRDEGLRGQMGEAAKGKAKTFLARHVALQIEGIYRGIAGGSG